MITTKEFKLPSDGYNTSVIPMKSGGTFTSAVYLPSEMSRREVMNDANILAILNKISPVQSQIPALPSKSPSSSAAFAS